MPRWLNCTCAWVHASVAARSKAVASWCLSMRSSTSPRDDADDRPERDAHRPARRHPHAAAQREDGIEHGADGVRRAAGRPSPRSAPGPRVRGRGSGPGRSRSRARPPSRLRRRRDAPPRSRARRASDAAASPGCAPTLARYSVCTKSLEKAGCAASAAGGASTSSAYEVSSMSRARPPAFATETRRTSASSSGETTTSSVVVIGPSRRTNSARSSVNVTS